MRFLFVTFACAAILTGTVLAQNRSAFSIEALVADAPGYVAARYAPGDLPAALIGELRAAEFDCRQSAAGFECTRMREAAIPCFDVTRVDISSDGVTADQNRLCTGAEE